VRSIRGKTDDADAAALELTMRDVLGGMEELSAAVAQSHWDYAVEILSIEPPAAQADGSRPAVADVIPLRPRAAG
jgi:hypothetical protein